jgi:hypothetical protein
MKKLLLTAALLLQLLFSYAQVLNNKLLGFQEPTTKIQAVVSDGGRYVYYYGVFRGELIRNKQTLLSGSGGDDLFLIKTDTAGNLVWARQYGSEGNEAIIRSDLLKFSNGALYFSNLIAYTTQLGAFTIEPYGQDRPASCIARIDTATGNVVWARRTSLLINSMSATGNLLMVSGNITSTRGPWLYENQLLQDSTGFSRVGLMYFDKEGSYLGRKQLYRNVVSTSTAAFGSPLLTADGQLFFYLSLSNSAQSILYVQDSLIALPNSGFFTAVFKTDTSFKQIRYRTLNQTQNSLLFAGGTNLGITYNAAVDSLYFILEGNNLSYTLDGFNVPLTNRSTLVVMDSSLKTARVQTLYQSPTSPRVRHQVVFPMRDHLLFGGVFWGLNQAPALVPISPSPQTVDFFCGLNQTLDINGPNRSMLVRSSYDFAKKDVLWLGDATTYDGQPLLYAGSLIHGNRLYFTNSYDGAWNPWIVDTSLTIRSGSMIGGPDAAEVSRHIRFFNDGSKFIVGDAYGKTAFDTTTNGIVKSSSRTDLFFTRLGANNQLLWYKRIFTSFRSAPFPKMVMKNNKAYVLITFFSPANAIGFNYFKFDTTAITVSGGGYSILLIIEANGNYKLLDVTTILPGRGIKSFDVYDNGDLAVITSSGSQAATINGISFPSQAGFFILRLNSTGTVLQAIKHQSANATYGNIPVDLLLHPGNESLTVISNIGFTTNLASRTIVLTDGQQYQDTFVVSNPKPSFSKTYLDILKIRVTGGGRRSTIIGPASNPSMQTPYVMNGTRLYLPVSKNGITDTLFKNTQILDTDTTNNTFFLLGLDSTGQVFAKKKFTPPVSGGISFPYQINKLTSAGNKVYTSGFISGSMQIDTIQVGYGGGQDGLTIEFDSLLTAKKVFRLQSIYAERIFDCDVYNDSLISFAYLAQTAPSYVNNRQSSVRPEDREQDAYVGDATLRAAVVLSVREWSTSNIHVYPNPIVNRKFWIRTDPSSGGRHTWMLYDLQGRMMEQGNFVSNANQHIPINVRANIAPGTYLLVLQSKTRKTTVKLVF